MIFIVIVTRPIALIYINSHFEYFFFSPICRVGKQKVNIPSFLVRVESQKHIDFALDSPFGGGRPGRVKRRKLKAKEKKEAAGEEEAEE